MATIDNIINVQLQQSPILANFVNVNATAIITSDRDFLNSNKRTAVYRNSQSVRNDFGSSIVSEYADTYFAQSPNPITANGYLVIGYWRNVSETIPASVGVLTGSEIVPSTVISNLRAIQDGSFEVHFGPIETNITGLDFRTIIDTSDIISIIQDGLPDDAVISFSNNKFIIKSTTTNTAITVSPHTVGTNILPLMGLVDGITIVNGTLSSELTPETPLEAIQANMNIEAFKAVCFIDSITNDQKNAISTNAQADNYLYFETYSSKSNLLVSVDNPVWNNVISSNTNTRMIYSPSNNRKIACAYMSKAHSVLFEASNTTKTMNLKTLDTTPTDTISEGDIISAKRVGLDVYTNIAGVPRVLTSGANDFWDNRYNLISLIDAVQVDLFNLLSSTNKVSQTEAGIDLMISQISSSVIRYVNNGFLSKGEWTSPNTFGDAEQLKSAIKLQGFYIYAQPLSAQSQVSRENRESPVIQIAVKNAGAVHSSNIILNFNK